MVNEKDLKGIQKGKKIEIQEGHKMDLTLKQQIILLLEEFDVPDTKRNINKKSNLRWLVRNISANNTDHPQLAHMRQCLRTLLGAQLNLPVDSDTVHMMERWE